MANKDVAGLNNIMMNRIVVRLMQGSAKKKIGDWYRAEACISYIYMDPYDLCIVKL